MKKSLRTLLFTMSFILCLTALAFGQRTTGDIEGTIKDQQGAVVPAVSITLTGTTVGFNRTIQGDDQGNYKFLQVPVGAYKISSGAVNGFAATTVDNINVNAEKTTTVDITVGVTTTVNTVDVSSDPLGVNIDTTDSKVQTSITSKLIEALPKGQSFTSLLKVSPGTRGEPLSGGFQVDGASGSENTFVVDGQPVENFRTGTLNANNNIPTVLVSEIQVKTGGFEAEFGGASGGVVSVVTKSGANDFHGQFGTVFESSRLQPASRFTIARFVSSSSTPANIANNPDRVYSINQPKDQYLNFYPTALLSGPVIKNRLWFLGSYTPQIFETTRTSSFYNAISNANFTSGGTNSGFTTSGNLVLTPRPISATDPTLIRPIQYSSKTTYQYGFSRLDGQIFNNLRGTVTYLWNPQVTDGNTPYAAVTTANPVNTSVDGQSLASGDYEKLRGGRTNSNNFTSQLVYTPFNKLLVNLRYGRSFLNEKVGNYAIPNEVRFVCQGSETAYTQYNTGCPGGNGFQNITSNSITTRDVSLRNIFNADAGYSFNHLAGRHEFKFGYEFGKVKNDVLSGYAGTGIVQLFYGQDYSQAGTGVSLPCAINTATCIGVGTLTRIGTKGVGSNKYQGLYFQDKWQPTNRLTLNLGVRSEKEDLPAFSPTGAKVASPLTLGFGKKIAPRLGVAYDLFGDGKTRIYGSYGLFYDRLKFELARGSFGADFYRVDYFPITQANSAYSYYTPSRILGSFTDPIGGGNPTTTGGISQLQRDFRIPSSLSAAQKTALGLGPEGGVDPDLKAFQQSEFTVGVERELSKIFVFSARVTRKNVEHAIEDHAILVKGEGEVYYIGNPGEGLDAAADKTAGYAKSAKPQRLYKGLELSLTKRLSNNYFFNANYTLSSLYGNYSGLASSDESTNAANGIGNGRTSPGVNRFFDYAINGYTATGEPDNGYLATDRRHAFKAYGGYDFDWFGSKTNSTELSFFQQVLSGTPITTFVTVVATAIPLSKRGDKGRTPSFKQTDISLSHRYNFGRDNRFAAVFEVNVLNIFNNNSILAVNATRYRTTNTIVGTDIDPTYNADTQTLTNVLNRILNGQIGTQLQQLENGTLPSLLTATGYRPNPISSTYGQPSRYQDPRNVRFGFRLVF